MKIVIKILQVVLGLFMITLGLNKFLVFIEIPSPPGDGGVLMSIYMSSGFLKLVGFLEVVGGMALVSNKFLVVGLTLITAIMFNATAFHAFHDPAGIGPAAMSLLLSLVLIFTNKDHTKRLLGV